MTKDDNAESDMKKKSIEKESRPEKQKEKKTYRYIIGHVPGPLNATSSSNASPTPSFSSDRSPFGPSAIDAPISRSALALS